MAYRTYKDSDAYLRSVKRDPVTDAPVFPLAFVDRPVAVKRVAS